MSRDRGELWGVRDGDSKSDGYGILSDGECGDGRERAGRGVCDFGKEIGRDADEGCKIREGLVFEGGVNWLNYKKRI